MRNLSVFVTTLFINVLIVSFASAQTGPQSITLEGNILTAASLPEEAANVIFVIQVKSPGIEGCVLYQESQTLNMTSSAGMFSLEIGTGTRSGTAYEQTSTLKSAFSNATGQLTGLTCANGTTYTPSSGDKRLVNLTFDDGSGAQSITQALDVQAVPYAMNADTLQGKQATDLIEVNTSTKAVSQANIESVFDTNADVTALVALINGTSTLYAQQGANNAFTGSVSFTSAPTTSALPTTANSLVNKTYADDDIAGKAIDAATLTSINNSTLPAGDVLSWSGTNWTATAFSTNLSTGATGTLPIANGGTNATTAAAARTSLSAAASGANADITSTTALTALSNTTSPITIAPTGALNLNPTTSVISSAPYQTALGSATVPAYGNSTTTNTGLYFPTATSLALSTAGTPQMTVLSSGYVGVGTISPSGTFDVEGGTAAAAMSGANITLTAQSAGAGNQDGGNVVINGGAKTGTGNAGSLLIGVSAVPYSNFTPNSLYAVGNIQGNSIIAANGNGIGFSTMSTAMTGNGVGSSADYINIQTNSTSRIYADGSGDVGVGTTSPGTALDVNGALSLRAMSAPAVSPSAQARIYFDVGTNQLMFSQNGGAYAVLATTSGGQTISGAETFSGDVTASGTGTGLSVTNSASVGGVLSVSSVTPSTSSTTGAVTVAGGLGVSGAVNTGGAINAGTTISAGSSITSPYIYGSSAASGTLTLDGTSNATAGNVLINPSGGNVGIGTATGPTSLLQTTDTAARTTNYTGVLHTVTNTSSTASINKVGMDIESTGAWSGTGAVNTGLVVNATGATTNYAATFNGGNVGIGTTTPFATLDVNGSIYASGTILAANIPVTMQIPQSANTGYWSKIAEVNFNTQYQNSTMRIDIASINGVNGVIYWSSSQGGALGTAPSNVVQLDSDSPYLRQADVVSVITTNSSSATVVDLYVRLNASYDIVSYTTLLTQWAWTNGITLPASAVVASLPSGAQTVAAAGFSAWSQGTPASSITYSGSVGIGTTSPQTALQVAGVISPATDNTYNLGSSSYRFKTIYATNSTINTSDVREKKDIQDSDFGLDFINKLRPVSYHWKKGDDHDLHYGLIAQETEKVVSDIKKGTVPDPRNVIVAYDKKTDRYGIKYTELISPAIKAIQQMYGRLTGDEAELEKLKKENAELKAYLCAKDAKAPFCK